MSDKKRRFGRLDWIELGLTALADHGTDGIKLEAICKAASLTRGSFYYHFTDHTAFLVAVTQTWADRQTRVIVDDLEDVRDATTKAAELSDAAFAIDYRLELGIRELARRYPAVGAIVKQIDGDRLATLSEIYVGRFGIDADQAAKFAFLEYAAFCGMLLVDPDLDIAEQRALSGLHDQIVQRFFAQDKA